MNIILGQEAIHRIFGVGRVTSLYPDGPKVSFTPYGYAERASVLLSELTPIPLPTTQDKADREALEQGNAFLSDELKQDIEEIMQMSVTRLRREVLVLQACEKEQRTQIVSMRREMDEQDAYKARTEKFMLAVKEVFKNEDR